MAKSNIFFSWVSWHFDEKLKFLLQVWQNFISFGSNFFSIPLLLKTFFSPWHRYNWQYPHKFDVGEFFNVFISNTFSRIIGALCRFVLVIIGILFQIFILVAGAIVILAWIFLPALLFAGLLFSFGIL